MSVIVKGMKMPENCIKCPLQFGGWCYASPPEIDERVAPTVDEAWEQGKPDWCPLVALPDKHGRLVDADALQKEYMHEHDGKRLMLIDVAPTIEPRCEVCEAFNKTRLLIPQPERKKGKWIILNKGLKVTSYKCSKCGKTVIDDTGYDVSEDYPFCHCGADMREPEDIPMEYFESGGR